MVPMEPLRTRRLLLGGTVLFVAGWLGLLALVAPALLDAVAAATLLPLSLVALSSLVARTAARFVDEPRWPSAVVQDTSPHRSTPGHGGDSGGATETD